MRSIVLILIRKKKNTEYLNSECIIVDFTTIQALRGLGQGSICRAGSIHRGLEKQVSCKIKGKIQSRQVSELLLFLASFYRFLECSASWSLISMSSSVPTSQTQQGIQNNSHRRRETVCHNACLSRNKLLTVKASADI